MPEITIYTRMMCGYCSAAKALLKKKGAAFRELDGSFDKKIRAEMMKRSKGGSTFPQIFIGDTHVGGCDELHALERQGKLDKMLAS